MKILTRRTMRNIAKALVTTFLTLLVFSINTPANAFAGTLENGNLAYAQSEFNKGSACNYLPGFESGYDAWHFVLTTRGATFQQDPKNPAVAVNLNFVFMRQDGSLFVIRSGAWVQTGKGAYTYTPVADRIRMVQAGSLAQINGSDSGIRLSHTCPGAGSITATPTTSPSPTASATPTVSPTPTASSSPRPTTSPSPTSTSTPRPTASSTPTPSASASPSPTTSPSPSVSPSPSLSPTPRPSATPRPSSTVIPTLAPRPSARASAIQIRPTSKPNALPTPSPTPQGITETPSPSPSPTSTRTTAPSPTPTTSGSAVPSPTASPTGTPRPTASPTATTSPEPTPPALIPPVLPVPPQVEEPKKLIFVEPKTPTVVPPQTLPEPPSSPIVITKAPEFGSVTVKPSGEITYTSAITDPKSTTVDVVEITYTSLSGSVVVVRKEFILAQRGDVPSIIQTGYGTTSTNYIFLGLFTLITLVVSLRLRGRRDDA